MAVIPVVEEMELLPDLGDRNPFLSEWPPGPCVAVQVVAMPLHMQLESYVARSICTL